MKFSICNEMYGDMPFEEAFAHAAELGYTGVEIAPFTLVGEGRDPTSISDTQVESIKNAAASNGLEIIGLHWLLAKTNGFHLTTEDDQIRAKTADYLCALARLCRRLGGDLMVFGSPQQRNLSADTDKETGYKYAADVFASVLPTLEAEQVTIALEPLGPQEGNFLLTADEAVELQNRIDSPWVRLHLDVKAMSSEPTPIPEIIRNHRGSLHHFHANDPNLRGPGMGNVEFEPIFTALQEIHYDGWISVEVFDFEPGVDALAGDSIRYMKSIEAKLNA